MNLYSFSQQNNDEMGILVKKSDFDKTDKKFKTTKSNGKKYTTKEISQEIDDLLNKRSN